MQKKTIFERLNEGEFEEVPAGSEADVALEEAAREYLDYIEGKKGPRRPGVDDNSRFKARRLSLVH